MGAAFMGAVAFRAIQLPTEVTVSGDSYNRRACVTGAACLRADRGRLRPMGEAILHG